MPSDSLAAAVAALLVIYGLLELYLPPKPKKEVRPKKPPH
jgi:hypothetical protein